jgi:hypothetical protein
MKNYLFHVGIDISKLKLDVVVIGSETPAPRSLVKQKFLKIWGCCAFYDKKQLKNVKFMMQIYKY